MYLHGAETERLRIRKLVLSDVFKWEEFFINNPGFPYLGLDTSLTAWEQSKDWINRQLDRYRNNRYGHHALISKNDGAFIGQCGLLKQEVEGVTEIEISYHILPAYWGKGFATEAAQFTRDYAVQNKVSPSLVSIIDIRNTRSQRVAEKLGMEIDSQISLFGLDVYIYRIII